MSCFVLTSNGKFFVLLPNILISSINISTNPVFNLGFTVSSALFLTVPKTVTVDSIGMCDAKSTSSGFPEAHPGAGGNRYAGCRWPVPPRKAGPR